MVPSALDINLSLPGSTMSAPGPSLRTPLRQMLKSAIDNLGIDVRTGATQHLLDRVVDGLQLGKTRATNVERNGGDAGRTRHRRRHSWYRRRRQSLPWQ